MLHVHSRIVQLALVCSTMEFKIPNPYIVWVFEGFEDFFAELGLLSFRQIKYDITLQVKTLALHKPRVYCMSLAELAEVLKQIEVFFEKG